DFQENSNDEDDERTSEEYLRDLELEFHERAHLENSKKVSDDEEMPQVKVLMALADDELAMGKNHAHNGKWIDITMRKIKILLFMDEDGASPSSEVMPLTYQDHSLKERPSLSTMKHTKPETQESSSKSVSRLVTICDLEPVTSLVPTEVKNNEQESKIDELTKLVQMLMNEKVKSSQKTHEPTSSSKMSQDVKPKILKAKAKPFPPCTHCGCHRPDDCRNYPECAICFDEVCTSDELRTKKIIQFRLCGRTFSWTLLEFEKRLGLYNSEEIEEKGFDVYFQGGLRSDENFNAQEYWLSISREENLSLSRSHTSAIRNPNGYANVSWMIARIARSKHFLSDEVLDSLSALIYCRALDTTTLRVFIDSKGRLIPEVPEPGVPRVAIPKHPRESMLDL
ncbi:hypothetical protein Tco_1322855, partial [Tanacetum coccineum]